MSKPINVRFPDDIFEKVDELARIQHTTKSAIVLRAVYQYMDAKEFLDNQPEIIARMKDLEDMITSIASSDEYKDNPLFGGGKHHRYEKYPERRGRPAKK